MKLRTPTGAMLAMAAIVCLFSCLLTIGPSFRERHALEAMPEAAPHVTRDSTPLVSLSEEPERVGLGSVPQPTSPGYEVRVVSEQGSPITGATVYVHDGRFSFIARGRTRADGVVELSAADWEPEVRIVATCQGYSPSSQPLGEEGSTTTLVLAASVPLAGRVYFAGEPLCMAGLRVVLEDPGRPRLEPLRLAEGEDPELDPLCGVTDADGFFRVDGTRSDRAYWLHAGGSGYFTGKPVAVSTAGDRASIFVGLNRVYGATLEFVDGQPGSSGCWSSMTNGNWHRIFQLEEQEPGMFRPLTPDSPYLLLAGIDPVLLEDLPDNWGISLVATDKTAPPPWRHDRGTPPGYDEYRVSYELRPLENGLTHISVALNRVGEGWGSLKLGFRDAARGGPLPAESAPAPGTLQFLPSAPAGVELQLSGRADYMDPAALGGFSLDVDLDEDGFVELFCIPRGTYRIRYTARFETYEHPSLDGADVLVDIGAETEELWLPVEPTGAVALGLWEAEGERFEGVVTVSLQRGEPAKGPGPRRAGTVSSLRSPYVISGLAPGVWTLTFLVPRIDPEAGSRIARIEVTPGETVRVERRVTRFPVPSTR